MFFLVACSTKIGCQSPGFPFIFLAFFGIIYSCSILIFYGGHTSLLTQISYKTGVRQFEREMENDATIGWLECSVTPLVVQLASNELKRVVRGPTAQTQSSARAAPVWRKRTLCGRARGILPMPGLSEVGAKAAAAAALQSSRLQILIPFSGAWALILVQKNLA